MARVTVIKDDDMVYVDQEALPINCQDLPDYFHAIQWYGDADPPYGEIEFKEDSRGRKLPNVKFTDIAPFKYLTDDHKIEKDKREKAVKDALELEAKQKAEREANAANPSTSG